MKNQSVTLKNHKYPPGTTKNQRGTLKNPKNPPGTMKNQPGTLENHKKKHSGTKKNNLKPWKPIKTDLEKWKTNLNPLKTYNNRYGTMKNQSGTIKTNPELYRVVMGGSGGYRRLLGGSAHFSWQKNVELHHNICILIIVLHNRTQVRSVRRHHSSLL